MFKSGRPFFRKEFMLQKIGSQGIPFCFKITYPVPKTYDEALELVKNAGGIKIPFSGIWGLPLRHKPTSTYEERKLEDSGVDRVFFHSRQRDGNLGGVAQMLMQPQGEMFEGSFAALSLENLRLTPQDTMGKLYDRAEMLGFKKCPITIIAAMSFWGAEINPWDNLVVVSDPFEYQGLQKLYALSRNGRETNPTKFLMCSGHPEFQIGQIAEDWNMILIQRDLSGVRQTTRSGEGFRWHFLFSLPGEQLPQGLLA